MMKFQQGTSTHNHWTTAFLIASTQPQNEVKVPFLSASAKISKAFCHSSPRPQAFRVEVYVILQQHVGSNGFSPVMCFSRLQNRTLVEISEWMDSLPKLTGVFIQWIGVYVL